MREELGRLVHPTISYGLHIKDRLDHGQSLDLDTEQAVLKGLLLTDMEAKRWIDFGGEGTIDQSTRTDTGAQATRRDVSDVFLGARYGLVCWLDEMIILDTTWSSRWNERKLEAALYGTNDRAWRFWEQARLAEVRPGNDPMEVFFLCVMLGFRGELRGDPAKLQSWITATQTRIVTRPQEAWSVPPELEPPTNVPPLHGQDTLKQMVLVGAAVLLALIPVVAFGLVAQFF